MNGLALAWVGIIAFAIIMYVVLDGFALGIGILTPFFKSEEDRDIMVSTILPVWDGNETWLVLGGACLYGAFPLAFSTILPAVYIPLLVMVVALIFRGIAFEFRLKAHRSKRIWDISFFVGSFLAAMVQGLILGTFVQGFHLTANTEVLEVHQWLNPFGVFCGMALVFGYALLGANRLILKTIGNIQTKSYCLAHGLQFVLLMFAIIVSIWTPYLDPAIKARWFNPQYMPILSILPITGVVLFILHWVGLRQRKEVIPFWCSVGVFVVCYVGFIISSFPYLMPRHLTYNQAAASSDTLLFMLIGAVIMLPILIYYTYYSYKIFSGKVTEKIEY